MNIYNQSLTKNVGVGGWLSSIRIGIVILLTSVVIASLLIHFDKTDAGIGHFVALFVVPVIIVLMFIYYEKFFPAWFVFLLFPIVLPMGGASISVGFLLGAVLVAGAFARHVIQRDVFNQFTFPWQLKVIMIGLALAFIHNPAMPTRLLYQYSDIGSGFKNYAMEAIKWLSVIYVMFYLSGEKSVEWLLSFARKVAWTGVFVKLLVFLSGVPLLFYLIGEDYDWLLYSGYMEKFFFLTAAFGGALSISLCWDPKARWLAFLRPLLIGVCFVAQGAGGTRSAVLSGTFMIMSYLFLKKRFAHITAVMIVLVALFSTYQLSPGFRALLPKKYHRIFVFTEKAEYLAYLSSGFSGAMGTWTWRRQIAALAWKDIAKSPIIGNGFRPAQIYDARGREAIYRRQVNFGLTHSFFMTHMVVYGIPVAMVIFGWFLWAYWNGIKIIWQNPKERANSLLAYCILGIPGIFLLGIVNDAASLGQVILLAMATVLIRRYGQENQILQEGHKIP